MTGLSVPKFLYAAAGFAMLSLGGCDRAGSVIGETLHKIKTVPVDANDRSVGTADDKKVGGKEVGLLVDTAKALTVGRDGILARTGVAQKLNIAVVDPLQMDRPDDGPPLDERVRGAEMDPEAALAAAAKALPDVPILAETMPEKPLPRPVAVSDDRESAPAADEAHPKSESPKSEPMPSERLQTDWIKSDTGRSIQVGSFGTMAAAVGALEALKDSHPAVEHYSASYQKIRTAAGRTMVRLRLGPVHTDAQAKALCDQLDIRDIWCHKAG